MDFDLSKSQELEASLGVYISKEHLSLMKIIDFVSIFDELSFIKIPYDFFNLLKKITMIFSFDLQWLSRTLKS